jgi:BASS family bile acid:Na+ symporter
MKPGLGRTAALLLAMLVGALIPQAHVLAGAIRWLVMAMLFLVFLQTRLTRAALHRTHLWLLVANIVIGFAAWAIGGWIGGRDLALAAFFAGITPTATAAPVIVSFLRGRVDYVIAAFMLTNLVITACLPLFLPAVLGQVNSGAFLHVLGSVTLVVFLPMALASGLRRIHADAAKWPGHLRNFSFGMWVTALFLISAQTSYFVRGQSEAGHALLLKIAVFTCVLCAVNFAVGRLLGGREFSREASQSLGQKNTTYTIYLALTYANPVVALGPTSYVLWHNLWNSWQLHRAAQAAARSANSPVGTVLRRDS